MNDTTQKKQTKFIVESLRTSRFVLQRAPTTIIMKQRGSQRKNAKIFQMVQSP